MKKRKKSMFMGFIALVIVTLACAACGGASASPASCAFIVGDGRGNNDAGLSKIVYPGEVVSYDRASEIVTYVPCNSRNYIINDGSVASSTREIVGDRNTQILAYTESGVPILISASSYWMLNQNDDALRSFYEVCLKHSCASSSDLSSANAGDQTVNNSTSGWIDLLDENFSPAMVRAALSAASQSGDEIWRDHSQEAYQEMADAMSRVFNDIMRATLGYPQDLFCGSGNSAWPNPNNPGDGEFVCSPVRFVIDQVDRAPVEADNTAEGVLALNAERYKNAEALYGDDAGYWLGLQDTIETCIASNVICVISIGGAAVALPPPAPAVIPVPSEE